MNILAYSCPTSNPFLDMGLDENTDILDEDGLSVPKGPLSTITEIVGSKKVGSKMVSNERIGSLSSSPTIISLLHTERLSAPKGRSSSLSSVSSIRDQTQSEDSKSNGQEFDLYDLEVQLPTPTASGYELQFEMETGSENQTEDSNDFLPNFAL